MFERFTDRARRVVVLAQARMLNHNYIGTEYVLLGLSHESEGVTAMALETLDISLEAIRDQVEAIIGRGQAAPTGHNPFTPRAKKVLELSPRESLQLGHNFIGTEHILLGLIREAKVSPPRCSRGSAPISTASARRVIRLLSGYTVGTGDQDPVEPWVPASGPNCPWCNLPLESTLAHRTLLVPAADAEGEPISFQRCSARDAAVWCARRWPSWTHC